MFCCRLASGSGERVFTGLVQDLGRIVAIERAADGARLTVATQLAGQLHDGDSVSVSGVCLTATAAGEGTFSTEAMNETLRLTSLSELGVGAGVNIELAMRASDRFGGHIVQGHVDGVGRVSAVSADGFSRRVTVDADQQLLRHVVHKGSIALDGVSLTVAELHARSFTVALIPATLERTTLGAVEVGSTVNLEVDVLAKYVERLVNR